MKKFGIILLNVNFYLIVILVFLLIRFNNIFSVKYVIGALLITLLIEIPIIIIKYEISKDKKR